MRGPFSFAAAVLALLSCVPARAGAQATGAPPGEVAPGATAPAASAPPVPAAGPTPAPPASAPAEEPEVNLLADPEAGASTTEDRARVGMAELKGDEQSFGATLEALGVEPTWSGYGDLIFALDEEGGSSFDQSHFNPILGARLGRLARVEMELEIEHGGEDGVLAEYAFFELSSDKSLVFRAGKFLIPIGKFNDALHPSFRWNQISRPAMSREAVPLVWSDVGVQLFGKLRLGTTSSFSYAAYAVNGLGLPEGYDLTAEDQPIRGLRDNFVDMNADKGLGSRLAFRLLEGSVGDVELGVSGYTGAIDVDGSQRLTFLDADLTLKLGDLLLRAETVQSYLGTDKKPFEPLERGSYLQLSYQLGKLNVAGRWDTTLVKPGLGAAELTNAFVPSILFAPEAMWSVRVEAKLPYDRSWNAGDRTYATMLAFMF